MGLDDHTTCSYQFIFDNEDSDATHIIQYFAICGLELCIKLESYVEHMFYEY